MEKSGSDKLTGPIQIYHNPKSVLSRGYLYTQEPDENGGHQKNAGKNTCHPIVQYIQWIILSFRINIPPDHELGLPDVQQLSRDGDRLSF